MPHVRGLFGARLLRSVPKQPYRQPEPVTYCAKSSFKNARLSRDKVVTIFIASLLTLYFSSPACASNEAILKQLGQLNDDQISKEIASPSISRLARVQAAREQFSRVGRLVQLKQFNSARLQLREGAASTLRKDLKDAQDLYITEQMVADSIAALEQLDAALRVADTERCTQQLNVLQNKLQQVIDALGAPSP